MHRALKPATALPWERRRLAGQNLLCLFVLLLALFPFLLPAADAIQLTNVASLRSLSRLESNRGRPFSLTGTVTMRDPDRNLFVIQDATGAMAIHPDAPCEVTPGNLVSLSADACAPYLVSFPDYPFRPAGSDIRTNFEAPSDWGNFHLSRLSGFLHPPKTGDYTFWIASDNSSELWLSSDEDPSKVRPIATVRAGLWVNQYEWSRYPFQRSDPIRLESGKAYYIEAFTEQLEQAEHLSVAWQGPGIKQSIPDSRYLTPWTNQQTAPDSGLLREYWTNYAQGGLASITGERRAESAISARGVHVRVLAENVWPQGPSLDLGAQLSSETNYRWVRGQGTLDFISLEHGQATLQVNSGQNRLFVRVATWQREMPAVTTNWQVQVEGVCEGAYAPGGPTMPGTIWVPSDENVRLFELSKTNTGTITPYPVAAASTNSALGGFFLARGVVTFNGRALGQHYMVVQDANSGIFIVSPDRPWPTSPLRVGDRVEIGGNLLPGKFAPRLRPSVVNVLGRHVLPDPAIPGSPTGEPAYRDGQWTELEGVVRVANTNGSMLLRRKDDTLLVCLSGETNQANALVDATVRLRGVVSLDNRHGRPLLLVPSSEFLEPLEPQSTNLAVRTISSVLGVSGTKFTHRVKVSGQITYADEDSFFLQESSGALQVRTVEHNVLRVGDSVEAVGFPEQLNSLPALTDAVAIKLGNEPAPVPRQIDSGEALASVANQTLVQVKATLLSNKRVQGTDVLELQLGQRVLQALLVGSPDTEAALRPGSLLRLTGVCLIEAVAASGAGRAVWEGSSIGAVRLLLRTSDDIALLRGPPWWSWKKAAVLIVALVVSLTAVVLRAQIMRRRFEKQQVARLAFARQLLENQESERRRIAANLHDSLGQNLLAIKNQAHLAIQATSGDPGVQRRLEDISGTVLNALEEVRQITHDLRPYQLDRLGLRQSIRALTRRVSETSAIEFACNVDAIDGLFPAEGEINVYRIVQEGVNNVIKHSQATEATVVLKLDNGSLTISIRDNGRGLAQVAKSGESGSLAGFGLSGIEERARIMGGTMELDTQPGQGVNVKVVLPLPSGSVPRKQQTNEAEVAHS